MAEAALPRTAAAHTELVKGLGLLDATMLVIGSMIGSGIFIVSADIARQVGSPGILLVVWLLTGVMTMIGALSFGELAAALPQAGGLYVYLREAFGSLWGFLYGWAMLLVVQTATIAAVAIAFAKFTGVLLPWFSSSAWMWKMATLGPYSLWFGELGPYNVGLNTQNLLAIVSLLVLTWVNTRGLHSGAVVQNIFTFAKTAALVGLIALGFLYATDAARGANFTAFWREVSFTASFSYAVGSETVMIGLVTLIAVASVGSLFASDAWYYVTFTAAEVKNPARNLPLSLALGAGLVTVIYLLANLAYLLVLPLGGDAAADDTLGRGIQFAAEDRVGTAVAEVIFGGSGAALMAVAIMISTFGCNNGLILAGARIYYAMARDGLFFQSAGRLNEHSVPSRALWVQFVWAALLCLSGTYSQLLDFIIFSVMIFYILTIASLFVLRRTRPAMERPYRAFGYPVLPALYLLVGVFIEVQLLRYKPQYTWPGLMLVALGIPVYFLWRRLSPRVHPDRAAG
jgi:APA family basic amino acid/polyamine antiporter